MPLIRHPIEQHAYVVNDLDASMHAWTETTGAGPWWVSRDHYGVRHTYRGQPFEEPVSYAFAGTGPTHVCRAPRWMTMTATRSVTTWDRERRRR